MPTKIQEAESPSRLVDAIAGKVQTRSASRLVDGPTMLKEVFHDPPTLRWLRTQTANRTLPFRKVCGKVLFDIDEVRNYINTRCAVKARP